MRLYESRTYAITGCLEWLNYYSGTDELVAKKQHFSRVNPNALCIYCITTPFGVVSHVTNGG